MSSDSAPTIAERLRTVTDLAVRSIPEAMGDRGLWEQRIKQVRNGFAHQDPKSATEEWQEHLVLLRTRRWVLITPLLSRAGVNPAALAERLQSHEPYRFQLRQARHWTPDPLPSAYCRPSFGLTC